MRRPTRLLVKLLRATLPQMTCQCGGRTIVVVVGAFGLATLIRPSRYIALPQQSKLSGLDDRLRGDEGAILVRDLAPGQLTVVGGEVASGALPRELRDAPPAPRHQL